MILQLNLYRFFLRLVCYALPLVAFVISGQVRFFSGLWSQESGLPEPHAYFSLLLVTTLVWAIMAEHYKVSSVEELFRERTGSRAALAASGATYLVNSALLFFYRGVSFSRAFLVISAVVLLILILSMRAAFRTIVRRNRGRDPFRILLVGADQFALRIAARLEDVPLAHCQVVGYVRLPGQEVAAKKLPLYELDEIATLAHQIAVDDVVIALHPTQFSHIPFILSQLEALCLPVRAVVDLGLGVVARERLFQFGPLQMLDVAVTPAESLNYSLVKRVLDVVLSVMVVIFAAPLMALIALGIKLTSRGPVLFTQERVGLNGKIFRMYKFRTMRVTPTIDSDRTWTVENDPRCTRFGAFLRKTSLDELPQFFNVLRGQMSVVGPRPERPHFVQKFLSELTAYNHRHRLKVGITGWAQVNGLRGDTSIEERLNYDLYYLQNWSLAFDLRIIAMTILSPFAGKNAY